jgi:CheY-like chemotaxis protein
LRQRGDKVRLDVIDTGIGVPADQQAEIFEEFRQLNNPARDSTLGLGLGLAIVSRLARLIGAEVQVSSRLEHGSRFSLILPLDRTDEVALPAKSAPDDPGGRILLIEDNAIVRQGYQLLLTLWGYEILAVATGEAALERGALENWRFDAVVADHRLGPGLTGTAAAAEIARRAGRKIPTVIVTGDTGEERLAEVSRSGFAMLHKPVPADVLRQMLASLAGNRKSS